MWTRGLPGFVLLVILGLLALGAQRAIRTVSGVLDAEANLGPTTY